MDVDSKRRALTVKVSNIPESAVAKDLLSFLEANLGKCSVFAVEIFTERRNWKSRGHGRVQFNEFEAMAKALSLSHKGKLVFNGHYLSVSDSTEDVIIRPIDPRNRVDGLVVHAGVMVREDCMGILESWVRSELWVLPEKREFHFFVNYQGECYKLEVQFEDVTESQVCRMNGGEEGAIAIVLKLKYAPKVFRKLSGPDVALRFSNDRYHICKEETDFMWVRTTDFSKLKSIGYLSTLCWEIKEGWSGSDLQASLPYLSKHVRELCLSEFKLDHVSNLVPVVENSSDFQIDYEVLFQLNLLVHSQKISIAAVNSDLFKTLSSLDVDTALQLLKDIYNLPSTCYNPSQWIERESSVATRNNKRRRVTASKLLENKNVMSCHRILVTPSKIFCMGPELESSNYIVKKFASFATDFVRVTFVDEDWGRLPAGAISTTVRRGIFAMPFRTDIYYRILSILQDGIVIGEKKFQFLAFSASQLRSNSVWMFASNDHVKAEDIRVWMGSFNEIRSISKCAARMGQLFSSSSQIVVVPPTDVEDISDIEVVTDGVKYCFSDGIGKISPSFARDVADMLRLQHVPSAFQIRYGGYKGVVAVNHLSHKLGLRGSMLKFQSNNYMLSITKCSESQPCYLNREIVVLLWTLGVKDSVFLEMLENQLQKWGNILMDPQVAINVLESSGVVGNKSIIPRMLALGYTPPKDPYLHMMLRSYLEGQISDLRSRCRIFVPKGRVLVGVMDETGTLEYGQVYVRVTMRKSELQSGPQPFFTKVDDTTAVVTGKVTVTKNPCLHPGDVRVLEAVVDSRFLKENLVDVLVFPQKGHRPHPNECSGGDLDGDLYFVSWDENLIPPRTVDPMDYTGRRPRIMDHQVTLEEIHGFFADYMVSDTLGAISNAHLVHADLEPDKALSSKCLELANLHSMAVDFAKTGAPAEMPRALRPRLFPDFMERWGKPMYVSQGALGKLYRATIEFINRTNLRCDDADQAFSEAFDPDLIVEGYQAFLGIAEVHRKEYVEKISILCNYYEAKSEVEILTGNLNRKSSYLQLDNRRYSEVKERIMISVKNLMEEVKEWFSISCNEEGDDKKLASAWYFVTYHPHPNRNCLGFPWAVGSILLDIKAGRNSWPLVS